MTRSQSRPDSLTSSQTRTRIQSPHFHFTNFLTSHTELNSSTMATMLVSHKLAINSSVSLISPKSPFLPLNPSLVSFPSSPTPLFKTLTLTPNSPITSTTSAASAAEETATSPTFHGICYVVGDNIDTDQIIPAEYLTLVPSNPDEYKKLGSFAMIGLPDTYPARFVDENEFESKYSIIIGGANFGCGSSREHAPVALGAAGTKAIVAESYARIFFRNSVSTGEVYPIESEGRICEEFTTGDVATVELGENKLINHTTGKEYQLKPIGDAGPVVAAGGIFAYARKTGMIAAASD